MQRSLVRPSLLFYAILLVTIAGGVLTAFVAPWTATTGMLERDALGTLGIVVLVLGGWALSLTLHEFGHAIVAYRGGDHEVAHKGYLSMDIRRYTDPVMSLVLPLIILAIGGIPLPGGAVWINRWALRNRSVASWVSLAGPLSNLAIGVVLTIVVVFVEMPVGLAMGLSYLASLQILAFVINILPVPGLDGFGAIEPYLSPQAREFGAKARPWAPLVLFALIIAVPPFAEALWDLTDFIFGAVGGDEVLSDFGQMGFMFWRY
ncbi:site-2 protease family protein [Prauserella sp. PE36]|uniref:Site-2 protease family protein n=1 Tax=Prauserella endophytica TaxID=1592324 RepID=A0ABY2RSM8_9PSEU|nr:MULTISPECIES: site-2 protease family protein [Prauserella]PXY26842.1 peptidase M50 [Prauserella coralliicola]RBM10718.1 site-2 protease family protein [Prauserella sp. PE36]TKG58720.1 site-2 protease family protein [Prauserella endophytica]